MYEAEIYYIKATTIYIQLLIYDEKKPPQLLPTIYSSTIYLILQTYFPRSSRDSPLKTIELLYRTSSKTYRTNYKVQKQIVQEEENH